MGTPPTTSHAPAIWARTLNRRVWAWSCRCGARFTEDLPSIEAARAEAAAHCRAARNSAA